ncbi:MAG: SGNH/GDSL hydrolase family protein [Clostridia bacterium]|nr:SGNH/GDSL hydrolase family protein [Clostridia bacterium]
MKTILFQGDSITDAGRNRDVDRLMGHGYATMAAGEIGLDYPNEFEILNRGISGNRIVDIYARIGKDIIALQPDYMSLLIGVNDVWHALNNNNGIEEEKFEMVYCLVIEELKAKLPNLKLMILEPFVLEGPSTTEHIDYFKTETAKRAAAAKRVADKYGIKFVPLQEKFNEAAKKAPETYWLVDGVHPTSAGHELIAREWIKAFKEIM